MRVLALETSSAVGSVAVVELDDAARSPFAAEVVAEASARVSNAHGESLLPLVDDVLRAARIDLASIDLLAVGTGPGSFTGTRIAVATAKGIAIGSGKPLRGVDAFAALAVAARLAPAAAPIATAIDARKGEVYLSVVRIEADDVVSVVAPMHVAPAGAWARIEGALAGSTPIAVGDGVALVAELSQGPRRGIGREVPRASAVGALAAARHLRAPIDEVDVLEPLYVRPPDVTLPTRPPGLPRRPTS